MPDVVGGCAWFACGPLDERGIACPDKEVTRVADFDRADMVWLKSEASGTGGGDCVEVAFDGDSVLVRHSKDPSGLMLSFTRSEWAAFLVGARSGTFDFTDHH
jgi:hypothetical protein